MSLSSCPLLDVPPLSLFYIYCGRRLGEGPEIPRPLYTMGHGMVFLDDPAREGLARVESGDSLCRSRGYM